MHYSSGVANHFFYLLAEGSGAGPSAAWTTRSPTCNGSTVTGIGRAKAEKIWYRALTVYMTSSTNYAGARTATINAATDLYGPSSAERPPSPPRGARSTSTDPGLYVKTKRPAQAGRFSLRQD